MEFDIEKCARLVMKCDKQHLADGMELPNQDKIKTLGEKETDEYLGILEADTIKQEDTKEKIKKEYLGRPRKLCKTKLYCRNLIKGINSWAVPPIKIFGTIFLGESEKNLKKLTRE